MTRTSAATLILNQCLSSQCISLHSNLGFPYKQRSLKWSRRERLFSSPSFLETSASREILNGRVLRLWKTEKGTRNNLHMNFASGSMRYEATWGTGEEQVTHWFTEFQLPVGKLTKQRYFLSQSLCVERRTLRILLFGFLQCSVNISDVNRIDWSPVRSNHTSD